MENKIRSGFATVCVNNICTLRCKECVELTPYQRNKINFNTVDIKRDIDAFFDLFDFVDHFDFEGGETLLHPDIHDIVQHAFLYKERFKRVHIITNGTLLPRRELLEVCSKNAVFFILSDYGEDLSVRKAEVEKVLNEYRIPYRIDTYYGKDQYCDGWIPMGGQGGFKKKNQSLDELVKKSKICARSQNMPRIKNGRVYKCTFQMAGVHHIPLPEGEYIDLHDTGRTVEKKIAIWKAMNSGPVTACDYCNGFIVDGPRVPAAEQFKNGELTREMMICY